MRKWLIMIVAMFSLSGCFASLSQDGILSTVSSASAAALVTAVAGPQAGVAAGLAVGVATDAAIVSDETVDLSQIPEADRAEVLKHEQVWMAIEHLGVWILGLGAFVIFILPLIAGYFMPNGKQRRYRKEMISMKNAMFDHPDVKMKDFKE